MASVIYLDSSDEEDDPVPCTRRVEQNNFTKQMHNLFNLQQLQSLKPNAVECKVERDDGKSITHGRHVEDGNIRSNAAAFCSTSGQARDSVGTQAERGAKMTLVGKSAADLAEPSGSTKDSLCRHFWQAGDYEGQVVMKRRPLQGAMDHVRVHPKFLHSNATSHKWALGAIAELLDNAIDEVANGATYVRMDKITNARDGNPALLVQDNGGGMSPDSIRQCMSLGYSLKNKKSTIGQYGNGFKTSTMRLGADVIVFTRNRSGGKMTQSIGLLSYTFLRKTGHEDTVVPMVDFQVSSDGTKQSILLRGSMEDWRSNLSTIMEWSPYSSEHELLREFNDIGWHGTKVIIFNLWLNDDGILELDFDSNVHDIQLRVGSKELPKHPALPSSLAKEHISNRYRLSLRVYASILYLEMPKNFQIILRGKPVEHYSIAMDLKFVEYIAYKPHMGVMKDSTTKEASVITTIGFTKEAPMINVHGFNVYHRNRLIMPFWRVFQENSSRGRGVIGVLEANFIEPAHDKQDFERTSIFLRLESRLKSMTIEYWKLHSHLVGYKKTQKSKKGVVPPQPLNTSTPNPISSSAPPVISPPTTVPSPTSSCSSGQAGAMQGNDTNTGHGNTPASGPSTPPRAGVDSADVEGGAEENGAGVPDVPVPRTTVSNALPEKVKLEVGVNGEHAKRQRDQEEPLVGSKRQRLAAEAVPLATRGAGDMAVTTTENEAMLEVLEQNTVFRQRCTEYELRESHWEQKFLVHEQRERDWELKVAALENEIMQHKVKYTKLVGQMESLRAIEAQGNKRSGVLVGTSTVVKVEPTDPAATAAD